MYIKSTVKRILIFPEVAKVKLRSKKTVLKRTYIESQVQTTEHKYM